MRAFCLLAAAVLALAGCAAKKPPEIDTETIAFAIDREANRDFPIALDLVHVLDPAALDQVAELSAAEWFARKEQVLRDWPTGIVVASYEVVPGQAMPLLRLEGPEGDAYASFVFARYFTPGVHRARLDRIEHAVVELGRDSFTVASRP
jgi:type VI secretion system protein